jgi:hypothetical protein
MTFCLEETTLMQSDWMMICRQFSISLVTFEVQSHSCDIKLDLSLRYVSIEPNKDFRGLVNHYFNYRKYIFVLIF